jgi:hypothetical protein
MRRLQRDWILAGDSACSAGPKDISAAATENLEVRYREARKVEQDHRRRYREWKENPERFHIGLLKALAVDLDKQLNSYA